MSKNILSKLKQKITRKGSDDESSLESNKAVSSNSEKNSSNSSLLIKAQLVNQLNQQTNQQINSQTIVSKKPAKKGITEFLKSRHTPEILNQATVKKTQTIKAMLMGTEPKKVEPRKSNYSELKPVVFTLNKLDSHNFTLVNDLCASYLFRYLNPDKISSYLKNSNANQKNRLFVLNAYSQKNSDQGIYAFLTDEIHLASLTTFVAISMKRDVTNFCRKLYGHQDLPRDNVVDNMLKDITSSVLDYDFRRFYKTIDRTDDYSLMAVCNNLLKISIPKQNTDTNYLTRDIPHKIETLENLIKEKNIDVSQGLDSVYLINNIPEIRC
ncbi:hypothetical protein HOK51_02145 [Candidatus Woesearchaeota archaeon]|jgi:hypothetical protein|nr:hypothetical protein [Candidatus Woesearchaeota archaeon]MBT6518617.1 hypothetical protein [Candidatus Woesearchaeota archaeon]MBT7368743.1 hypothetical protein [Candidatus Woesearchaeota archaeon]